jgi:hypothetical protein
MPRRQSERRAGVGHQLWERLRYYWHELYYFRASSGRIDFGLRCKQVVEQIDLGEPAREWNGRFRFRLHLSFCSGCNYYWRASQALGRIARAWAETRIQEGHASEINRELLSRHCPVKPTARD